MSTVYRIADSHAHIYPDKIAEKATAAVGDFYGTTMAVQKGRPDILLENGTAIGVEKYLVCSVATKLDQVDSITGFIADECAKHPEFLGLGAYHPDETDPARALDKVEKLGLKGIKLHPDFQKFNIDDEKMFPLYEEIERRGLVILFHTGDDRFDFSAPHRLMSVLDRYPDLTCIAAHFGGYRAWDEAQDVLAGANMYYDTSSSLFALHRDEAVGMIEHYGADRMMFGVDFPMWNHEKELQRFLSLGLSKEDNQAILYDNFARLFGLDE